MNETPEAEKFRLAVEGLPPKEFKRTRIMNALFKLGVLKPIDESKIRFYPVYGNPNVGHFNWTIGTKISVDIGRLVHEAAVGENLLGVRNFGKAGLSSLRSILGISTEPKVCPCCGQSAPIGTVFSMPESLP